MIKQICENKGKRQLVVATHNSNVVVNGDSELVNVMGMNNGQIKVKTKGVWVNQRFGLRFVVSWKAGKRHCIIVTNDFLVVVESDLGCHTIALQE